MYMQTALVKSQQNK